MKYFSDDDLLKIKVYWNDLIDYLEKTVEAVLNNDYAQPIKPYLKFGHSQNRIIAMPAYVGGEIKVSGIKWIASFPNNIMKGIKRAHCVLVLNDVETGRPIAIFNSALISIIRTIAVTGLMLRYCNQIRSIHHAQLGIIGLGPIGRYHYWFMEEIYGDKLNKIVVYDQSENALNEFWRKNHNAKLTKGDSWRDAYKQSDIVITCTTAYKPYIDLPPKPGSLHMNVSLRDYSEQVFPYMSGGIVVDDWNEVCREGTSIERFHIEYGLSASEVTLLADVVKNGALKNIESTTPIMFNPMGMAVFDITVGTYCLKLLSELNIGMDIKD